MAFEVQSEASTKRIGADEGVYHSHDFRALNVDRRGIEVIDFDIRSGSNGMCEWSCVLWKLGGPKRAYVGNALDRPRAHVGRELLIPEDGETLFEAKLKPITAGHAVARPVVEVFVGDDCFDAGEVAVGGGIRLRQDVFGVEDVETLVFHGSEVEVADGDDHEDIQVVLKPESFLVPTHRPLERVHRIGAVRLRFPGST